MAIIIRSTRLVLGVLYAPIPYLVDKVPSEDETGVDPDVVISFSLRSFLGAVSTFYVKIDGVTALTEAGFEAGFGGTCVANAFNGFDITITHPDFDFYSDHTIRVWASNSETLDTSWGFTVRRPNSSVICDNTILNVIFKDLESFQDASDPSHYHVIPGVGAVPVDIYNVIELQYTVIQSGLGSTIWPLQNGVTAEVVTSTKINLPTGVSDPSLVEKHITLSSHLNSGTYRIVAQQAAIVGCDVWVAETLVTPDPESGSIVWSIVDSSAVTRKFLPFGAVPVPSVGEFLSIVSDWNNVQFAKVLQTFPDGSVEIDKELLALDPLNGDISWSHTKGLDGVILETSKPTSGTNYALAINLYEKSGEPYIESGIAYVAVAPKPRVLGAEQLDEGQIIITFSDPMRQDEILLDPTEYTITGPSTVLVKTVQVATLSQVMITTVGMGAGSYTLTVSSSSPHDIAGNPIDPIFNQAIFTGSPTINSRSIFTDKGPITKPALTIQTGLTAEISTFTRVYLPTGSSTPSLVGKYINLTGTITNAGDFRVTSQQSASPLTGCYVGVAASFTMPDPASGSITWTIYDPRDGLIADDPDDVVVRINGTPVTADAVIGLLGQIVMPTVPLSTDTVVVDYCWINNPVVDLRRLNSKEFKLNNWNRDSGYISNQHRYRFNNTLIRPETFIPLDIRSTIDQPLQRDLKYRAYERAYSSALNDPNLLLLNSPVHRVGYPPLSRTVTTTFVNYQATALPDVYPTNPWTRHGSGSATIVGTDLLVVDNTMGPFPGGEPIFWTRPIDLT